jgi:NAD(P)H-hydrate repair Nnr-like enzyme with NAD(P)H-hydrate dehydratase domain
VLLAARMAAMAGAGRVFAAFAGAPPAFDPVHPELMCRDAHAIDLQQGAAVIGPGLGTSRDAHDLVARALSSSLPLVLDADALNLVAQEYGLQQRLARRHAPALLTPHPAEAARLMGSDTEQVQANRLSVAAELASRFNACVILKGSGSIVAAPDGRLAINTTGNAAHDLGSCTRCCMATRCSGRSDGGRRYRPGRSYCGRVVAVCASVLELSATIRPALIVICR